MKSFEKFATARDITELKNCRVCSSEDMHLVLSLGDVPLAGDFKESSDIKDQVYPLNLVFCSNCKVVQVEKSIDLARLFNTYSFSSSTIPNLVTHFQDYSSWIVHKVNPKSVLEIGCNDGILLKPLSQEGIRVHGVDMSENISAMARERGLDVKSLKFAFENLDKIKEWVEQIDLITASNAFPHNDDPNGFLKTAQSLLSGSGVLALEVMYGGNLKSETQWDTVYHEHLHIHTVASLEFLLRQNGFNLFHVEWVPMHAGSIRILASLDARESHPSVGEFLRREAEDELNTLKSWKEFGKKSHESIKKVHSELSKLHNLGHRIWAYGASGRASMWLNVAELEFIEMIVDASPLRYNHFLPGTNTPIVPPSFLEHDKPDFTLITAWNYADSILSQHELYDGKWVVPLPQYREIEASN